MKTFYKVMVRNNYSGIEYCAAYYHNEEKANAYLVTSTADDDTEEWTTWVAEAEFSDD